jgi:hypothetical protein
MNRISRILLTTLTLWLFLVVLANAMVIWTGPVSGDGHSWVSQETLLSLARHHGTDALKITELDVSIWRDGQWMPVLKNHRI